MSSCWEINDPIYQACWYWWGRLGQLQWVGHNDDINLNWHQRQYFLLRLKKIIWKSRPEAGSIFAPGFRSWKVLFFHIRPPLLCHDFYLFINSLFWCQINFPLPKVFHILIEGTFSKSFEQCTFEGTNLSMCIKQPHSQIYCMHAQINLPAGFTEQ